MSLNLKADVRISKFNEIDNAFIMKHQIQLLILDIDNTLAVYDEQHPSEEVKQWLETIRPIVQIYFISNNRKKRVAAFCQDLGPFISFALKPMRHSYQRILKMSGVDAKHIACVGDQLFSDIIGANRMGFMSILTKPLAEKDIIYTRMIRKVEKLILNRMSEERND